MFVVHLGGLADPFRTQLPHWDEASAAVNSTLEQVSRLYIYIALGDRPTYLLRVRSMNQLEAITLRYRWRTHRQMRTNCDKQTQLNVGDGIPDFSNISLHLKLVVLALDRPEEKPFLTHAFQHFPCLVKTAGEIFNIVFSSPDRMRHAYLRPV